MINITKSLLLLVLSALYPSSALSGEIPDIKETIPTRPLSYFDKTHAADLEIIAQNKDFDLVLIGDSITNGWDHGERQEMLAKALPGFSVLNLGISGDVTQGVLFRLEDGVLDGVKAKTIMVMIGTNNIGARSKPENIALGIERIVQVLKEKVPDSKILLLGIFPRGRSDEDGARRATYEVNAKIKDLHDGEFVFYKDIKDVFLNEDSTPNEGMKEDRLHLSPVKGYQLWIDAVKDDILRLAQ